MREPNPACLRPGCNHHPGINHAPAQATTGSAELAANLSVTVYQILVCSEFIKSHRTTGVELLGGDSNLSAESELRAIGECSRDIGIDTGGIDFFPKTGNRITIVAHYALAVVRTVSPDMFKCLVKRIYHLDTHLIIKKFRPEHRIICRAKHPGGIDALKGLISPLVGINQNFAVGERGAQAWQVFKAGAVNYQAVEGIADAHPTCLGIADNVAALAEVTELISWILNLIKETLWK